MFFETKKKLNWSRKETLKKSSWIKKILKSKDIEKMKISAKNIEENLNIMQVSTKTKRKITTWKRENFYATNAKCTEYIEYLHLD